MNKSHKLLHSLLLIVSLVVVSCKKSVIQQNEITPSTNETRQQSGLEKKAEALLIQNGFKKISAEEATEKKLKGRKIKTEEDLKNLQTYLLGSMSAVTRQQANTDDTVASPPPPLPPVVDIVTGTAKLLGSGYADVTWSFSRLQARSYPSLILLTLNNWHLPAQDIVECKLLYQGANIGGEWSWSETYHMTYASPQPTHKSVGVAIETISVGSYTYIRNYRTIFESVVWTIAPSGKLDISPIP